MQKKNLIYNVAKMYVLINATNDDVLNLVNKKIKKYVLFESKARCPEFALVACVDCRHRDSPPLTGRTARRTVGRARAGLAGRGAGRESGVGRRSEVRGTVHAATRGRRSRGALTVSRERDAVT